MQMSYKGMRGGQALVMVLLILGVAVTVGLSIVARSITEISVSTIEDESVRALEAAEAGVEKALGGIIATGGDTLPSANSSFNIQTAGVGNGSFYEIPYALEAGEIATVDLAPVGGTTYSGDSVQICWGKGSGARPAIEVILYYRQILPVRYLVGRRGFDPDETRANNNGFSTGVVDNSCPGGPAAYGANSATKLVAFNADLGMAPLNFAPMFMRIRMLYNSVGSPWQVAVVGIGDNIPVQGKDIVSVGQAGDSTQKLHVIQSTPDLPLMFDAALFSGGGGGLVQ